MVDKELTQENCVQCLVTLKEYAVELADLKMIDHNHMSQYEVGILNRLINEHFELKKEIDKCDYELKETLTYLEQYEKALDKACEELHDSQMSEAGIDEDLHGIYPNFINAEEWKEWCMKGD